MDNTHIIHFKKLSQAVKEKFNRVIDLGKDTEVFCIHNSQELFAHLNEIKNQRMKKTF